MATVLITGVGRAGQVGEALARAFADTGARLALVDRTPGEVERRAAELRERGHEAHAFACDLTSPDDVARTFAAVHGIVGDLDALVCAAGGFAPTGPLDAAPVGDWDRQLAINLTTAHLATRAALPFLRRRRGAIVYFASAAALPGAAAPGLAAYAAAKSAVLSLMRTVAADERPHGVRANAVAPTSIRTAANLAAMGDDGPYVERADVASAVVWLCSEEARAITGEVVKLG